MRTEMEAAVIDLASNVAKVALTESEPHAGVA